MKILNNALCYKATTETPEKLFTFTISGGIYRPCTTQSFRACLLHKIYYITDQETILKI